MGRRLGGHVSSAGGIVKAISKGDEIGASIIQIFSNSPRGWKASRVSLNGFADLGQVLNAVETKVECVVSHASYLINLASPDQELYTKSRNLLIETMTYASEIGIAKVVLHVGSHRGAGFTSQVGQIVDAIQLAIEAGPKCVLLLENSAGQGDSVGSSFYELGVLVKLLDSSDRLGICLDTQHLFASGVAFETDADVSKIIDELKDNSLLDVLGLIHLNDSKVALGAHVDRHANLGEGFIGKVALANLLNHPSFALVDIVLEFPGDGTGDGPRAYDVEQAALLLN